MTEGKYVWYEMILGKLIKIIDLKNINEKRIYIT